MPLPLLDGRAASPAQQPPAPAQPQRAGIGALARLRRPVREEPEHGPPEPEPPARQERQPARAERPAAEEAEIKGQLKRLIFKKAENDSSFHVFLAKEGHREFGISTNYPLTVDVGDRFVARGTWGEYKGRPTFKASSVVPEMPSDVRGIAGWALTVAGVGKASVDKLVKHFGADLKEALADPDRLAKAGIKQIQAQTLSESWNSNSAQPELIAYLKGLGLGDGILTRVIRKYGTSARMYIDRNPWVLAEHVEGVGFETADRIARRNGNDMRSFERIRAAVRVSLKTASQNGHCGLRPEEAVKAAAKLTALPDDLVQASIDRILKDENLVFDEPTGLAYMSRLYHAERYLASHLLALMDHPGVEPTLAARLVAEAEAALGIVLDPSQRRAALTALTLNVCIITGGPGTGKSTTLKVIHHALDALKREVVSAAPTGRAAKRISEVTGKDASTLHRLLQMQGDGGSFAFDSEHPFSENWFVVDEFSMVDVELAYAFVQAIKAGSGLTIVGDRDQLPSVGAGQVLRDLIESGKVPTVVLEVTHRQAEGSGIVTAAHRINRGEHPNPAGEDKLVGFNIQRCESPESINERLLHFVTKWLPGREIDGRAIDVLRDVQVMAATRQGGLGVAALNQLIKGALNPALGDDRSVTFNPGMAYERTYTVGDRVMQTKNNYVKGVYNGEVGSVCWVGEREGKDGKKSPAFEVDYPGGNVTYARGDYDEVELAYAITVHKSQGCEFPVVIMVCPRDHRFMLRRNLFYTAVTRAKRLCLVIGDDDAVLHAVRTQDSDKRNTGLTVRLGAAAA